jgi:hypothetical protein
MESNTRTGTVIVPTTVVHTVGPYLLSETIHLAHACVPIPHDWNWFCFPVLFACQLAPRIARVLCTEVVYGVRTYVVLMSHCIALHCIVVVRCPFIHDAEIVSLL